MHTQSWCSGNKQNNEKKQKGGGGGGVLSAMQNWQANSSCRFTTVKRKDRVRMDDIDGWYGGFLRTCMASARFRSTSFRTSLLPPLSRTVQAFASLHCSKNEKYLIAFKSIQYHQAQYVTIAYKIQTLLVDYTSIR